MKQASLLAGLILLLSVYSFGQKSNNKDVSSAAKTAQKATQALDEIMSISDKAIPADLLR